MKKNSKRRAGGQFAVAPLLADLISARKLLVAARKKCPKDLVLPGYAFIGWNDAINALQKTIREVRRCSSNSVLSKPHNQHDETTNSPTNGNHTVDVDPGTQPADASHRSGHTGVRAGMVN